MIDGGQEAKIAGEGMKARSRFLLLIPLTLAAATAWAMNPTPEEAAKLRAEVEPVLKEFFRQFAQLKGTNTMRPAWR